MRRRAFIAGLACTAATSRAEAQQAGKVYRIAIAHPSYPASEMNETVSRGSPRSSRSFAASAMSKGRTCGSSDIPPRGRPHNMPIWPVK